MLLSTIALTACLGCHSVPGIPEIQGQTKEYLQKQMQDFRSKSRSSTTMHMVTIGMSTEELNKVAEELSMQTWGERAIGLPPETEAGKKLVEQINCRDCHGENLEGFKTTPRIRGQDAVYVAKQLENFRSRARTNDLGSMFAFAQFLSDDDIQNIADYLASLSE